MPPINKSTRGFALYHALAMALGKVRLAQHRLGMSEEQRYEIAHSVVGRLQEDGRWPELNAVTERSWGAGFGEEFVPEPRGATLPTSRPADDLEHDVEAALIACGGDWRATIKGLILTNQLLWEELNDTKPSVSSGYARGKLRRSGN